MSDFVMEGGDVPVRSPVHSPTLQRAANTSTEDFLRALMATVVDFSTAVADSNAQQAQTSQHVHAVAQYLPAGAQTGGRRPEFHGEPARYDGTGDIKAWLRTLELIFDAKKLNLAERFCIPSHFLHSLR